MPIYDYLCDACGHEFEREQSMNDRPVRTCPRCRARKVRRLISRTSFVLKGGGWYRDLYSSSKPSSKGQGGGESAGDASSAKDASSEKKGASSDASTKKGGADARSGSRAAA